MKGSELLAFNPNEILWRRSMRIRPEPMTELLVARARRAASVYGVGVVVKATKISYERLRYTNLTGKNKAAAARSSAIVNNY